MPREVDTHQQVLRLYAYPTNQPVHIIYLFNSDKKKKFNKNCFNTKLKINTVFHEAHKYLLFNLGLHRFNKETAFVLVLTYLSISNY